MTKKFEHAVVHGLPNKPMDSGSTAKIRFQERCNKTCPAFDQCLLMPLAIEPKDPRMRKCLVKDADPAIKRAMNNIFVNGHSGVIDEMKRCSLAYAGILTNAKNNELTTKDRLRLLKDQFSMLLNLEKLVKKREKPGEEQDPAEEPVAIDAGEEVVDDPESLAHTDLGKSLNIPVPQCVQKKKGADPAEPDFITQIFGKEE
jgi:hypothetical protein